MDRAVGPTGPQQSEAEEVARARRMAAAVEAGWIKDQRRIEADPETAGKGRWESCARIEVQPHDCYELVAVWEDAGTERYPPDWTPAQIAVSFLRDMADEIESGALPEEPPSSSAGDSS